MFASKLIEVRHSFVMILFLYRKIYFQIRAFILNLYLKIRIRRYKEIGSYPVLKHSARKKKRGEESGVDDRKFAELRWKKKENKGNLVGGKTNSGCRV